MKISKLIKDNLLLILIFLVATIIRTWDLSNTAIFFDDAGHDLLIAKQSLEQKTLPLLGIASSVPRFKQGPVTIWYEMVLIKIFGFNLTLITLGFVALSLISLVLVYEFCDRYLNKRISMIATYLIALSPLAIAQARMPYHTNPIPLATVLFLFALVRLYEKRKHALFWAVLAWSFLFQFELAVFPTLLVIPWIMYRTKQLSFSWLKVHQLLGGFLIGLLPQIIYDFTNRFSQLGLFIVWVGYRLVSLFGGEHSFSGGKVVGTGQSFAKYGGRIFATDNLLIGLLALGLIVYSVMILVGQFKKKKIKPAMEVILVFGSVLSIGYFLHGSPSEAYFPPFIVILPLLIAFALNQIFKNKSAFLTIALLGWGLISLRSVFAHRLFVSNPQPFSYGCSVKNQRQIVDFIAEHSDGDFKFDTTREIKKFAATFDNLRWLANENTMAENNQSKKIFYLEGNDSPLRLESDIKVRHFGCSDVYFYE